MFDHTLLFAEDLMTRDVAVVHPETPLRTAVKLMADRHISGLPVVDADGKPVGMLTEGDLLRWHGEFSERQQWWLDHLADGQDLAPSFLAILKAERGKVASIMTATVHTIAPGTSARDIAKLFFETKIKRAPVVENNRILGLVSRSDLIKAFGRELDREDT
jgi:CBS domain-containing protein